MGPLLVLVSPRFRENVVVTCKIGSFLCSLVYLLEENVIVFFLEIKFQNGAHLKKKGLFWSTFRILYLQGKSYKNSFSTYLTHIHTCILLTLLTYLPYQFWKKKPTTTTTTTTKQIRIYQVWFLFGMIPGVDSYSRHFGTINK